MSDIGLGNITNLDHQNLPMFLTMKPEFCKKFSFLRLHLGSLPLNHENEKLIHQIMSKFDNLVTLQLRIRETLVRTVHCIAMLKQVINLSLIFFTNKKSTP